MICIQKDLSTWTDHGTTFKWSTYGGGRFRELDYHYIASCGTQVKRSIYGSGRSEEVVGQRSFTVYNNHIYEGICFFGNSFLGVFFPETSKVISE